MRVPVIQAKSTPVIVRPRTLVQLYLEIMKIGLVLFFNGRIQTELEMVMEISEIQVINHDEGIEIYKSKIKAKG